MSFFFSSRRRHTRCLSDWSSDVCSSDLAGAARVRRGARPLSGPADSAESADVSVAAPAAAATPKRRFRLKRLLVGALAILVIGAFANLVGWDLRGWFSDLWDTISGISTGYLVAAVTLKTVQTSLTAFGWYSILRFAY